ncbi:hypothetical protein HCC30_07295 [Streptomyces sp. HNM0574]|nr:hypothetical protein [Streptomyces sp. HNM0574]
MTAAGALQHGDDAARELQSALKEAGFTFPSLTGDYPVNGRGHVALGGMSAEEALRLARYVRELGR